MKHYNNIKTYFPIFVWPTLVLVIHQLSIELGLYDKVKWLDTPIHFLGGMAIATGSYYLFAHLENKNEFKTTPSVKVFLAMAITALTAVLWEQVEFGSDTLFHTMMQPSNWDTMKDLTMGVLGSAVVSLLWKRK